MCFFLITEIMTVFQTTLSFYCSITVSQCTFNERIQSQLETLANSMRIEDRCKNFSIGTSFGTHYEGI